MLIKEKREYRQFKNLERAILLYSPSFYARYKNTQNQFVHENYVYISYQAKEDLYKEFWNFLDKYYFFLPDPSAQPFLHSKYVLYV